MAGDEVGGHRRLGDISLDEVRAGRVWKLVDSYEDEFDLPLEDRGPLEAPADFSQGDWIVYSAVMVDGNERVQPLLLVHEFGGGYGGDYLEWVGGSWRQLGLVSNADFAAVEEFIADPHPRDATFNCETGDYRAQHRDGFLRHRDRIAAA
jgi:hypothetical protein